MSYERHTPHRRSLPLLSIGVDALWSPRASSAKRLTPSRAPHLVHTALCGKRGAAHGGKHSCCSPSSAPLRLCAAVQGTVQTVFDGVLHHKRDGPCYSKIKKGGGGRRGASFGERRATQGSASRTVPPAYRACSLLCWSSFTGRLVPRHCSCSRQRDLFPSRSEAL